ncbi:MAG TPA: hypothetical protein VHI13_04570 [Candidatus Kapabacteria bacterium]|nr:hypothetical protein [Candidatus Kapabacteria bacterium]
MACRDMNHLLWLIETFTMYFLEPDSRQLYWLAAEFLRNAPASASSHESLFDLVNDDARTAVTLLEDHADGAPNQFEINEAAERLNRMVSSWPTGS